MAKVYEHNVVLRAPFSDRFYFCRKVESLGEGVYRVIGQKFDVSESVNSLLEAATKKRKAKR